MTLVKEIEFSMGHRLHLHKGGCSNFHGHNYQATITLDTDKNYNDDIDEYSYIDEVGFFIDFGDIKKIVNEVYDHKFLMNLEDPFAQLCKDLPGFRFVPFSPTAENICVEMEGILRAEIVKNSDLKESDFSMMIKLYETSNSFIEL